MLAEHNSSASHEIYLTLLKFFFFLLENVRVHLCSHTVTGSLCLQLKNTELEFVCLCSFARLVCDAWCHLIYTRVLFLALFIKHA